MIIKKQQAFQVSLPNGLFSGYQKKNIDKLSQLLASRLVRTIVFSGAMLGFFSFLKDLTLLVYELNTQICVWQV